MIDAVLSLPPHLRERLASALETRLLSSPYSTAALRSVLGGQAGHAGPAGLAGPAVPAGNVVESGDVERDLARLDALGITGSAAAAFIRTLATVADDVPRPDLVWSGPEVPGLHARNTRRVFEELIGAAERSIWASTYAFFDGPRAFQTLAERMDERPAVDVTLLLNIQRRRGDSSIAHDVVARFAERFWAKDWPGARRPRVYYDPRALEADGPSGVLHAKAVVVDDEAAFVTSANLTEAALDRNIELGLLVRDRALAASMRSHFEILIGRGVLRRLEGPPVRLTQ